MVTAVPDMPEPDMPEPVGAVPPEVPEPAVPPEPVRVQPVSAAATRALAEIGIHIFEAVFIRFSKNSDRRKVQTRRSPASPRS